MRIPALGKPLPQSVPLDTKVAVFRDNGTVLHGRTRSAVEVLGGTPVIWVTGISGAYAAVWVRVGVAPEVEAWEGM